MPFRSVNGLNIYDEGLEEGMIFSPKADIL